MGSSGGYFTYPRMFNGKTYKFHEAYHRNKSGAKEEVKKLRASGNLARIVSYHGWHFVYVRRKE